MIQYRNCMKNMSHRLPVNILMTRWQEKYPPENVPGELIGLRDGRSPSWKNQKSYDNQKKGNGIPSHP